MSDQRPIINTKQILKEQQNLLECFSGEKRGFLSTLLRFYKGHLKNLLIAAFLFIIKASPLWVIPIVTANVINIATDRPQNAVQL